MKKPKREKKTINVELFASMLGHNHSIDVEVSVPVDVTDEELGKILEKTIQEHLSDLVDTWYEVKE